MPYIQTMTNVGISGKKEQTIKQRMGEAIELIPGKSDEWLMLNFDGGCRMAFRGISDVPCAMIDVQIFGKTTDQAYDALTERICAIISDILEIPSDRIYVKYTEKDRWGYNGFNF